MRINVFQLFLKVSLIKRFAAPNLSQMSENKRNFLYHSSSVEWRKILREEWKDFYLNIAEEVEEKRLMGITIERGTASWQPTPLPPFWELLIRYVHKCFRKYFCSNILAKASFVAQEKCFPFANSLSFSLNIYSAKWKTYWLYFDFPFSSALCCDSWKDSQWRKRNKI